MDRAAVFFLFQLHSCNMTSAVLMCFFFHFESNRIVIVGLKSHQ